MNETIKKAPQEQNPITHKNTLEDLHNTEQTQKKWMIKEELSEQVYTSLINLNQLLIEDGNINNASTRQYSQEIIHALPPVHLINQAADSYRTEGKKQKAQRLTSEYKLLSDYAEHCKNMNTQLTSLIQLITPGLVPLFEPPTHE